MQTTINNIKINPMKNKKTIRQSFKLVVLAGFLFWGTLVRAGNGHSVLAETEKQIKEQVKLETPIAALHESQAIEIIFTTNENGHVNFVLAKTNNATAKHEVEKQFSRLQLSHLNANVAYSIVINFKTL